METELSKARQEYEGFLQTQQSLMENLDRVKKQYLKHHYLENQQNENSSSRNNFTNKLPDIKKAASGYYMNAKTK